MKTSAPVNKPIIIGKISGVFGVHGWVKIFSHTEPRDNILQYKCWLVKQNDAWHPMTFIKGRRQGKTIVVQLKEINDCDKAHALIGCDIAIDESQLKALGENEFYWRELQGLKVVDVKGNHLGCVSSMMATGANDVVIVQLTEEYATDKKTKEILIPYIESVIKKVNLDEGLIEVDWDEGFD